MRIYVDVFTIFVTLVVFGKVFIQASNGELSLGTVVALVLCVISVLIMLIKYTAGEED